LPPVAGWRALCDGGAPGQNALARRAPLAALVVVQFLISPDILVMCLLLALVGVGRGGDCRVAHAEGPAALCGAAWESAPAVGRGPRLSRLVRRRRGRRQSRGAFPLAPLSGGPRFGYLSPGRYMACRQGFHSFWRVRGAERPPVNYWLGHGGAAVVTAFFLPSPHVGLAARGPGPRDHVGCPLGPYLLDARVSAGPAGCRGAWWPGSRCSRRSCRASWRPSFLSLIAAILALGLDAIYLRVQVLGKKQALCISGAATVAVGLAALLPIFLTSTCRFTVQSTAIPAWVAEDAPSLPPHTVLLTVPFAVSGFGPAHAVAGSGRHALPAGRRSREDPDATGGPVGQGAPGSARHILSELSVGPDSEPTGTTAQLSSVRAAVRSWHVGEVVIDGPSATRSTRRGSSRRRWGRRLVRPRGLGMEDPHGGPTAPPAASGALTGCQATAAGSASRRRPLALADVRSEHPADALRRLAPARRSGPAGRPLNPARWSGRGRPIPAAAGRGRRVTTCRRIRPGPIRAARWPAGRDGWWARPAPES